MLLSFGLHSLGLVRSSYLPPPLAMRRPLARALCNLAVEAQAPSELKLTPFWQTKLKELTRPAAVSLVPQLSSRNSLCFEIKDMASSLVAFAKQEKEKRPDHLLLIRVGEFYEAYGLDALMLVQHAGLNPMGKRCRAGCPIANLQPTLDSLTAAGLTVAVYEEMAPATGKGKLKYTRALSQVVSPASPVYMYEACLSPHQIAYRGEPPPIAGVTPSAAGYTVVFVHVDSRTWRVHQRLSEPALKALLAARTHAPPLLVADSHYTDAPAAAEATATAGEWRFMLHAIAPERRSLKAPSPADFPSALLRHVANENAIELDDFTQLPTRGIASDDRLGPPTALYVPTATQVGLLPTAGIPDLPSALLPEDAPAACAHFLRRWLLLPPRPEVADACHDACVALSTLRTPLPSARPVPVGKLVGLLLAKQANAATFLELRQLLGALHSSLGAPELDGLNTALLKVVAEESGLVVPADHLRATAEDAVSRIAALVAEPALAADDTPTVDPHALIPASFFNRNEPFRAMLQPSVLAAEYAALDTAATELCDAVREDVAASGSALVHDIHNNALHLRPLPPSKRIKEEAKAEEEEGSTATPKLEPAKDRNNRALPNRLVTRRLREATGAYHSACADMQRAVVSGLQNLCAQLQPEMPTVVTAAHYALLSTTLTGHVATTLEKGWRVPTLLPVDANLDEPAPLTLSGVWPYWLPQRLAVRNDVSWEGLWLLTAPNMAGKSSLMRSMLTSALLANAGLLAPVSSAAVPRYDAYFLRTSSFDAPAEGKSAFAQEMGDLQVMAAECTPRSLVMLDEIGRGTSTEEGSALCAALLEWLDTRRIPAIFATHLHEIEQRLEQLPAPLGSLSRKCLPAATNPLTGQLEMSFTLAEGICRTSHALHAARKAGLPPEILRRAEALLAIDDAAARLSSTAAARSSPGGEAEAAAEAGVLVEEVEEQQGDAAQRQLAAASEVLRSLSGRRELVRIPADWQPPPRLRGRSCVYVLQKLPAGGEGGREGALYVGESDSISRRLKEHRASKKWGGSLGGSLECVLVEVADKSEAVEIEELTIRRLKEMGMGDVQNVAHG